MGHVDHRDARFVMDAADLVAHLHPELGVEVGKRLVQQHRIGPDHQGPGQGDPLLLAAGELVGFAEFVILHADGPESLPHPLAALRARNAPLFQAVGDILVNAQVRP